MIKIFVYNNNIIGEKKNIIMNGLNTNSNIILSKNIDDCDYIFLSFRDFNINIDNKYLEKLIVIDYTDSTQLEWKRPCYRYFKRSVVNKKNLSFCKYPRHILPISYSIKNECLEFTDLDKIIRDIDISVFFTPSNDNTKDSNYRGNVAKFIKKTFNHLNIHVGIVGKNGKIGRCSIQKPYYDMMFHSKIVINCNPDNWEGDYRLFEALSSRALVFTDRMITPVINPFIDKKHLVYYDRNNFQQLKELVNFYLHHDEERNEITTNGYNHAIKYHKANDRINEIL